MNDTITAQSVVRKQLENLNTRLNPQQCADLVTLCGKDLIWKIFQERFFQVAPTVLLCRLEVITGLVQGGLNHNFNIEMAFLGLVDNELELELICNEYLHYLSVQK